MMTVEIVNTNQETAYRELLKEYCGHIPYLGNDDRIRPVSLEGIYTPLRIQVGRPGDKDFRPEDKDFRPEDDNWSAEATMERLARLDRKLEILLAMKSAHGEETKAADEPGSRLSQDPNKTSVVYARPGGGKTTWSKRVCLACLAGDNHFLSKQLPLMKWQLEEGTLPLLLCCRNLTGDEKTDSSDFLFLAYRLTLSQFGRKFLCSYSEKSFRELLRDKAERGHLLLLIDGWDELAIEESEKLLEDSLRALRASYPKIKCVITTRSRQRVSEILNRGEAYTIEALNKDEVRKFCRRWHEEIFRGNYQMVEKSETVIRQLESPYFSRISYMTETPYLLSNLLRCSQHYGHLPSSISELYERSIDMMVGWFTKLDTGLEQHDVKIQLAYIAYTMTKKRRLTITHTELGKVLGRCFYDLDGMFRSPLQDKTVEQYLKQFLDRNCVLETSFGGLYHFPHRELQDFFSAMAVVNGYIDLEDSTRDPLEILKRHYTATEESERTFWENIVVFSTLISGPRFARAVVGDIMEHAEAEIDEKAFYSDLLFSFVLNNVDLLKADHLRIYELCFARHITPNQIDGICQLAEQNEVGYAEFSNFIKSKIAEGLKREELLFCFAWAIICAKRIVDEGENPLHKACTFLLEDDPLSFSTGLLILDVFSWCKYEKITGNEFYPFYMDISFKLSPECCAALSRALTRNVQLSKDAFTDDIARMIFCCTLADYIHATDVGRIIPEKVLSSMMSRDEITPNSVKATNELLAIYPIPQMDEIPSVRQIGSNEARTYYAKRFELDLENARGDSCVFSFNRCLVLGVWTTEEEVKRNLNKIKNVELDTANSIRLDQLQKMLAFFSLSICTEGIGKVKEYEFYIQHDQLSEDNVEYISTLSKISSLPPHITNITNSYHIIIKNNLAYLIRRGELRSVRIEGSKRFPVKAEELLEEGVKGNEGFSHVNYALTIAGFYKNHGGEYGLGLEYLRDHLCALDDCLSDIKRWWLRLAKEKGELEGAIVLMWLYELKLINLGEKTMHNELSRYDAQYLVSAFTKRAEELGEQCEKTLATMGKT